MKGRAITQKCFGRKWVKGIGRSSVGRKFTGIHEGEPLELALPWFQ